MHGGHAGPGGVHGVAGRLGEIDAWRRIAAFFSRQRNGIEELPPIGRGLPRRAQNPLHQRVPPRGNPMMTPATSTFSLSASILPEVVNKFQAIAQRSHEHVDRQAIIRRKSAFAVDEADQRLERLFKPRIAEVLQAGFAPVPSEY